MIKVRLLSSTTSAQVAQLGAVAAERDRAEGDVGRLQVGLFNTIARGSS